MSEDRRPHDDMLKRKRPVLGRFNGPEFMVVAALGGSFLLGIVAIVAIILI